MRKCELTNVTLLVLLGGATPCPYLPQDVAMVCGASLMMGVVSDREWVTPGLGDAADPPRPNPPGRGGAWRFQES